MRRIIRLTLTALMLAFVTSAAIGISINLPNLEEHSTSTITFTKTVSATGTITITESLQYANHSTFAITKEVFVEPAMINEICIVESTTTVVSTSYVLPTDSIGQGSLCLLTTTTVSLGGVTTTIYDNITIAYQVSGAEYSCTLINPYYGVTQSLNPNCFCV